MSETGHVTVLERGSRTFHIVGTAHVSQSSVAEVEAVIDEVRPDVVCIELDKNRLDALLDEDRWKRLDIFQVIRQKRVPFLLASLALSSYQARLGEQLGVKPGSEMLAAIRKAEEVGAELVLADRDIQITLRRTWRSVSFWSKFKLLGALLAGFFEEEEISDEDLEKLKSGDALGAMLEEFAQELPQVKRPLIDERDAYLMSSIEDSSGETVVAVVGAAHVPGMKRHFGEAVDRAELDVVPPASRIVPYLKWAIPAIVVAAFTWGYFRISGQRFGEMLTGWILPNSIFAGLFSLIAGARPLTALAAFVASPITSLNPTIQAGFVAGLVEAWLRKPTVDDCARIREDSQTLRGLYRNRFTRVLLVFVAATLGSALGAYIGLGWVLSLLR